MFQKLAFETPEMLEYFQYPQRSGLFKFWHRSPLVMLNITPLNCYHPGPGEKGQIGGGTIVSLNKIITCAHIFYDENGKQATKNNEWGENVA